MLRQVIAATILLAAASGGPAWGRDATRVRPGDIERTVAQLGGPPAKGSDAERSDFRRLKEIQAAHASREAIDAAHGDRKETLARFLVGTGLVLKKKKAPQTAALVKLVATEVEAALADVKGRWVRTRPFVQAAEVRRCPGTPVSNSYPSSHAAFGAAAARVLTELYPHRAAQLQARGVAYGESRLVCGYHYPSDVEAGRILGTAVADLLLASAAFRQELEAARAETVGR